MSARPIPKPQKLEAQVNTKQIELDLYTRQGLQAWIDQETRAGRFTLFPNEVLDLGQPRTFERSRVKRVLEETLDDGGGLKIFELDHKGRPYKFMITPNGINVGLRVLA